MIREIVSSQWKLILSLTIKLKDALQDTVGGNKERKANLSFYTGTIGRHCSSVLTHYVMHL